MLDFGLGVIGSIPEHILLLLGWIVVVLVFAFPALEASAFVGFVFPGEITVILGGVAASQGLVPLWAVIVAAVSGAIIGDSIGYLIGRRWGTHLLYGTVGRLPVIRGQLDKHLGSAEAYVRRRKGRAVLFGRFTAALRVLVPGLAGMSKVRYPSFLAYNVAGGVLWGSGFVILGYVAGASYARVEQVASRAGLVVSSSPEPGPALCQPNGVLAHVHPNWWRTCCLGIRGTDSGRRRTRRDGSVRSPCRAVDCRASNRAAH